MAKARLVSLKSAAAAGRASLALPTVDALVARERPSEPLVCLRPATIAAASRRFVRAFPGDVLYAVKCNPEPRVLRAVWAGGVRHFDCASLPEIALVRRLLPRSELHFMHPVKSRPAIRAAFHQYGVTDFALDSKDELEKILQETVRAELVGTPPVLGLFVRLAVKQGGAYDLSGKFGVEVGEAAELLRLARPHAARLGLCFHVGSQCLEPAAYARAMAWRPRRSRCPAWRSTSSMSAAGFRSAIPDTMPPPLDDYMAAIDGAAARFGDGVRLWAEPGRALVAGGGSVVVQVQLRRGDALYVNDGVYGGLSDAGHPGFRFPARRVPIDGAGENEPPLRAFALYGPTCDSADYMKGPFLLPEDIDEGDWIELGQLGAYGACLRTRFNGFDSTLTAEVADPPLLATPATRISSRGKRS